MIYEVQYERENNQSSEHTESPVQYCACADSVGTARSLLSAHPMHVYVACVHLCMYACAQVCMYACVHVCKHMCMCVNVYVCMCTHV